MSSGSSSLGPLSVGNVVSAGVRIYRSHLQQYFKLALLAYVWLIVPIYGWAKYSAISGQISRLAFQELINQPESNEQSRNHTNPRMWSFLAAGILVGLRLIGIYLLLAIAIGILLAVAGALIAVAPLFGIVGALLIVAALVGGIIFFIRYYSRLIITEVPLAVEPNLTASSAIRRSSDLTESSVGRIQWIIVVAFLVTLLLNVPLQIVSFVIQGAQAANPESALIAILSIVFFVVSILCGALLLPFWQVIKAVIYYDLRSRREGLGLELRDRKR
ncbi:hypothetical protein [Microcoleus sp. FACHB-1515]|uniref:hypothetical protein n=1 Tax=Cyanophyceae TaxID=3028117 RepID=UPI001F54FC27|nr:hypothetical protein [Microcoleus sp. FACHB-1515]